MYRYVSIYISYLGVLVIYQKYQYALAGVKQLLNKIISEIPLYIEEKDVQVGLNENHIIGFWKLMNVINAKYNNRV